MLFCFGQNSGRILASRGPSTWREGPRVVKLEHHHLRCCSRHSNIPGGPCSTTGGEIQLLRGSSVLAPHSKHLLFQIAFRTLHNNCEWLSCYDTVPNRNAIVIPVISGMSGAAGAGAAFVPSSLPRSIFPKADIVGMLGLNLRGRRGNGDNGEKNWLEGCRWVSGSESCAQGCCSWNISRH